MKFFLFIIFLSFLTGCSKDANQMSIDNTGFRQDTGGVSVTKPSPIPNALSNE